MNYSITHNSSIYGVSHKPGFVLNLYMHNIKRAVIHLEII